MPLPPQHGGQQPLGRRRVHEQCFEGVAHARPLDLGVVDDLDRHGLVGALVEVDVHDAGTGLDYGDGGLGDHGVDEVGTAARDEHVDEAARA